MNNRDVSHTVPNHPTNAPESSSSYSDTFTYQSYMLANDPGVAGLFEQSMDLRSQHGK